jgi:penicillin-binding protein 1A
MAQKRPQKRPIIQTQQKTPRRKKSSGFTTIGSFFTTIFMGAVVGFGVLVFQIPSVESLLAARPLGSTTIFDRNGKVVASLHSGQNREFVKLESMTKSLKEAVIASEDIRFYQHWGIDLNGIGRAVLSGGQSGGGSTITQQLAKNLFLTFDRTFIRKISDIWLALQLERVLSKDKILEMYLNQIYLGHGVFGVEAASKLYFGKHASELKTSEAAVIAGLLPAPEYYSPFRHPEQTKAVQKRVLERMVIAGYLTPQEKEDSYNAPLHYAPPAGYAFRAPYFISQVLSVLNEELGAETTNRGGLSIHTTLDLDWQEYAEKDIRRGVERYAPYNVGQGALVAIEPGTGEVRALVGGKSYSDSQFNRATQAKRQPGSTFKPFVYLTAFTKGFAPSSYVLDAPLNIGGYAPSNYDRSYHGYVSYERALAKSLNIPAVKVAQQVGIQNVIELAHRMGINAELPENLSVALGSAEVTPLELATAYATIAADGVYSKPRFITRVTDDKGNTITEFKAENKAVVEENAIAMLDRCLNGVIRYGSGTAADFGRPAGGKTGTTSDNRDTWFAGYTPNLACVIWLGNDDNSKLASSSTGGMLAAPLWRKFMSVAHQSLPYRYLSKGGYYTPSSGSGSQSRPITPQYPVATTVPANGGEGPESGIIQPQVEPSTTQTAPPVQIEKTAAPVEIPAEVTQTTAPAVEATVRPIIEQNKPQEPESSVLVIP